MSVDRPCCLVKRLLDIVFAACGLLVLSPLLLTLALVVKLSSPGGAVFAQARVGRGKREFQCYKLRTMWSGTRTAGTHEVSEAAVTPIGRLLRATKLDEIPQLWNVLKGEMSIVGPRPCLPVQRQLVEQREIRGVFDVRPGITGLAQVEGLDMSRPEELSIRDAYYVEHFSLVLDVKILVATLMGRGGGDRVSVERKGTNSQ